MGINVSTEAHSGEPRLYNPRWPSILFLKELAQFVPGTELWVSNFFTLYLEKVIKWFSPQASPTGGCYFKLKNKIRKQNEKGDQITHLWKGRHTNPSQGPSQAAHSPHLPLPPPTEAKLWAQWCCWQLPEVSELWGARPGCPFPAALDTLRNCQTCLSVLV